MELCWVFSGILSYPLVDLKWKTLPLSCSILPSPQEFPSVFFSLSGLFPLFFFSESSPNTNPSSFRVLPPPSRFRSLIFSFSSPVLNVH